MHSRASLLQICQFLAKQNHQHLQLLYSLLNCSYEIAPNSEKLILFQTDLHLVCILKYSETCVIALPVLSWLKQLKNKTGPKSQYFHFVLWAPINKRIWQSTYQKIHFNLL